MVLKGAGHNLAGTCTGSVHKNDDRHGLSNRGQLGNRRIFAHNLIILRSRQELLLSVCCLTLGGYNERSLRKESGRHTDRGIEQSARIVAKVKHQTVLQIAALIQSIQRFCKLTGCALLKLRDTDI